MCQKYTIENDLLVPRFQIVRLIFEYCVRCYSKRFNRMKNDEKTKSRRYVADTQHTHIFTQIC